MDLSADMGKCDSGSWRCFVVRLRRPMSGLGRKLVMLRRSSLGGKERHVNMMVVGGLCGDCMRILVYAECNDSPPYVNFES